MDVDEPGDGSAEESLRRQIGLLSADRDCLRYLLGEEKKKGVREINELRQYVRLLEARLMTAAAVVAKMKSSLSSS